MHVSLLESTEACGFEALERRWWESATCTLELKRLELWGRGKPAEG